jgi:hypothetical protein
MLFIYNPWHVIREKPNCDGSRAHFGWQNHKSRSVSSNPSVEQMLYGSLVLLPTARVSAKDSLFVAFAHSAEFCSGMMNEHVRNCKQQQENMACIATLNLSIRCLII